MTRFLSPVVLTLACFATMPLGCTNATEDRTDPEIAEDAGFTDPEACYASSWEDDEVVGYTRYEYDPSTRVLVQRFVDAPTLEATVSSSLYYRVDEKGHLATYAGDGFRHDYSRDTSGNVVRFDFVYEGWSDLTKPTTAYPYMYYEYANAYDAGGLLESSTLVSSDNDDYYAASKVYTHDSEGRCASMVEYSNTSHATTTYTYKDGQLEKKVVSAPEADGWPAREIVTTYSYDASGQMIAWEQDGGGHWAESADGIPDVVAYWHYGDDGAWTYEYRDYTTDIPNCTAEVDGVTRSCGCVKLVFSTGCAALAEQIPRPPAKQDCSFDAGRSLPLMR